MVDEDLRPIPKEIASQLCNRIKEQKARKLFTQCWGCVKASKGNPEKMCYYKPPDYRGCGLVNKVFDAESVPST